MRPKNKTYRVFVTYSGFDETKHKSILRVAKRKPMEETFDPLESRSQIVFLYASRGFAERLRMRLLDYLEGRSEWKDRFSVGKVVADGF